MAALIAIYTGLLIIRAGLAWRHARRAFPVADTSAPAAILQPILSGDPALPATLRANALAHAGQHLYWLVDEDDLPGQAAAHASAGTNVTIVPGPGPRDGENPKVAKLDRAFAGIAEDVTVVLDDDTQLSAAGLHRLRCALERADLVTGLPVFVSDANFMERFIGGFVNGNAVLTYLPAAAVGAQHTINGMIYAVRTAGLRGLGGFGAIRHQLTDDYAMAQLFEKNGLQLLQAAVPVHVGITIQSFAHGASVLRRWLLFAQRYFRENLSPALFLLVVLPAVLAPLGLAVGLYAGGFWLWLGMLAGKACVNRLLLWRISGFRSSPVAVLFEVLADVCTPFYFLSALGPSRQISWRSRRIEMEGDRIRYR